MSLLAKAQQAARACICSGQHSSAHLWQFCDRNVPGWLPSQGLWAPVSRGWCTASSPAPPDGTLSYPQDTTGESEQLHTEAKDNGANGMHGTSGRQFDSKRRSLAALPEVDFDVADNNYIRMTGNVGHDPELRETAKGKPVANLFMYVYQGKNNESARINVQAWGDLALLVHKSCRKGMKIRVDGYLKQNMWLSKDAVKVSRLLVNATEIAAVKARKVSNEAGDTYQASRQ